METFLQVVLVIDGLLIACYLYLGAREAYLIYRMRKDHIPWSEIAKILKY